MSNVMGFDNSFDLQELLNEVLKLYDAVAKEGQADYEEWQGQIEREEFKFSALNLGHYLALRRRDIRPLQLNLSMYGLSSLGRLESNTLVNLETVLTTLEQLNSQSITHERPSRQAFNQGALQLEENAREIFGPSPDNRSARIMVTMPLEAAEDPTYVEGLIANGMNLARINCAHDSPDVWQQMVDNIRAAADKLDRPVRIMTDIPGPKIRTEWVFTYHKKPQVSCGDLIRMTRNNDTLPADDEVIVTVGTSIPQIFEALELGHPVLFDDGSVETEVVDLNEEEAILKVVRCRDDSVRLKADKGLNFPETDFSVDILDETDKQTLAFAVDQVDIIAFSFIRDVADMEKIQAELQRLVGDRASDLHLCAKIETVQAVDNLADIIVAAAGKNPFSLMIARGDLAVESGYIRLSELQQEILWVAEAAHIPVVWGTEVMANMIKTGIPTRSEVTDATEGAQAEAVMLNKVNHISEVVVMLDALFAKAQENQYKKSPRLRALAIADN